VERELETRGAVSSHPRRPSLTPYLLIAPALTLLFIFNLLPSLAVFLVSLFHWNLASPPRFVGLKNYQELLHSASVGHALEVTALYALGVVLGTLVLGLAIAYAMSEVRRAQGFYRTAYLLPYVLPLVSTSVIWLWIYQPQFGILNSILGSLHLPQPGWIESTRYALPSVILFTLWHDVGFSSLILLAALLGVPRELKESARVDGASEATIFFRISLPWITPALLFVTIVTTLSSFRSFTQIYELTGGGPVHATTVLAFLIYLEGFQFFRFGYAAALSVLLFVILVALTWAQLRLGRGVRP
jgi:ABC-type sugar transport system permease subunit